MSVTNKEGYNPVRSADIVRRIQDPDGFIHASIDPRYGHPFGRDAMEMIEDLIEVRPEMAERSILALATLQGTDDVVATQEKPGKMPHEQLLRYTHERNADGAYKFIKDDEGNHVYARVLNSEQAQVLEDLALKWGIADSPGEASKLDSLTVYFNSDTTQMFVDMVARCV